VLVRHGSIFAAALAFGTVTSAQGPTIQAYEAAASRDGYYAAGERVTIASAVGGDAVVAGREIVVQQPVAGDILAAGATITISAAAGDDVRVAGRDVVLEAPMDGDVTAAGRRVTLGPNSRVTGRTWLAGGDVRVGGVFDRSVSITAARVVISGELRDETRVVAQDLEVLPAARILAPLIYEGPSPARVAAGATMAQPIAYRHRTAEAGSGSRVISSIIFALHLFVGGLLLFLVLPTLAVDPVRVLRNEPGLSLAAGLTLFFVVPVAALMLVATFIGIPVGLVLGAAYLAALFLGLVVTAYSVGKLEAAWFRLPVAARGEHARYLFAGAATLAAIRVIPVIGTLAVWLSILFGLGALGVWLLRTSRGTHRAAPVTG
jgi:hypothetical protein